MIEIARRYNKEDSRRRILSVCVRLFIEKGYKASKMVDILAQADVTSSSFHNIFPSKDAVLMTLTEFMIKNQFEITYHLIGNCADPTLLYAVETAMQLTLAEQNENLREIYVEAYTQPKTAELIYQRTSSILYKIFGKYLPEYSESDFYELDIGTAGMTRAYMSRPCDKYFTLEKKLERFITLSMNAYNVPKEKQDECIAYVMNADITSLADAVMKKLFSALEMEFDFKLKDFRKIGKMA